MAGSTVTVGGVSLSQSTWIVGSGIVAFMVWIIVKGRLPAYLSLFGAASGGGGSGGTISSGGSVTNSGSGGLFSGLFGGSSANSGGTNNSASGGNWLSNNQSTVQDAADQYGVPASLLNWQGQQESGGNPNAQNGNATGLFQFMPGTAANVPGFGYLDATDPYESTYAAAAYDRALYDQTGSWSGALTRYGTLANVPQSVWTKFQSLGLP